MSARLQGIMWDIEFGGMAPKAIAVKLADNANDDGESIFPAKATVARKVECSKRTVDRWVDTFLVTGLLFIEKHGGGRRSDETRRGELRRTGRTSEYSLNVPLMEALAEGAELSFAALVAEAQAEGKLDADGVPFPHVIEAIKAAANGAAAAPFANDAGDDEAGDETVQPLHRLRKGKGCNRVTERVQPCHGKGAAAAPEPSRNPHLPSHSQRGRGKADSEIQDMLDRLSTDERRAPVVTMILAPLVRLRRYDAPDREYSLGILADWLARETFQAEECTQIVDAILAQRRVAVKQADVEDAVKAHLTARKALGGTVLVSRANTPAEFAAWLAYAQARPGDRTMRQLAQHLENHGAWTVPTLLPPTGNVSASSRGAA